MNTGYVQHSAEMPLPLFLVQTSKNGPELCVLAPLYHLGDAKELEDGQRWPAENIRATNNTNCSSADCTVLLKFAGFEIPRDFSNNECSDFAQSSVVCRSVQRVWLHCRPHKTLKVSTRQFMTRAEASPTWPGPKWQLKAC